ncbi:MAG: sensor histidine kinase [Chloroflexi bacterium]|nr:sensor histidine kinase [Chloroflexota bacterium]
MPWDAPLQRDLLWLLLGIVFATAIAFVLRGQASLFYYLVAAEGWLTFRQPSRRIGWVVCVVAISLLVNLFYRNLSEAMLWLLPGLPVYLLLAVAAELVVHREDRRVQVERLLSELRLAHRRLEDYTAQAEALAVSDERTRVAREIHDTLGHTMTALDLQLELLVQLPDSQNEARKAAVAQARALAREGLVELRRAVQALQPGVLETFSLPEAIEDLLARFQERTRAKVIWQVDGQAVRLPPPIGIPLYRATQEALTNITRHAAASQVGVVLCFAPEAVTLTVEDDGRGGEPNAGFGLRGLRERAEALGGEFHAGPRHEGGFRLEMRLPR